MHVYEPFRKIAISEYLLKLHNVKSKKSKTVRKDLLS